MDDSSWTGQMAVRVFVQFKYYLLNGVPSQAYFNYYQDYH